MDVKKLGNAWKIAQREIAYAAESHPPQMIKLPLLFPFSVRPAQSTLEGHNVRQRQGPMIGRIAKAVDVRLLSEEFQALKRRDADLLAYLNRYGWWDGRHVVPTEEIFEFQDWLQLVLRGSKKFRGQQLSSRGLFGRLPGLLAREFTMTFEWNGGAPIFKVETDCCVDAITATVLIDVARGIRYRKCKRRDCNVLFPAGRAAKVYHSEACRHSEVMRRSRLRDEQKKAE